MFVLYIDMRFIYLTIRTIFFCGGSVLLEDDPDRASQRQTCVMRSHVHHSQRGSLISDCHVCVSPYY